MAMWKRALANLRQAGKRIETDGESVEASTAANPLQGKDYSTVTAYEGESLCTDAMAGQLMQGVQLSLAELEDRTIGWLYRGHPVMVFGVEVPEVEDVTRRQDFWQRVHLLSCCSALDSGGRSAWVGTDLGSIRAAFPDDSLMLCQSCLTTLNHDNYRRAGRTERQLIEQHFDFVSHVQRFSHQYFSDKPLFWKPGERPAPFDEAVQPGPAEASACPSCGCAPEGAGWRLPETIAAELSLAPGTCIPCAMREAPGCLHIDDASALSAARQRFNYFAASYSGKMESSWKLAEAILPLTWLPLLRGLEDLLPPPELFYQFDSARQPAVLAWPGQQRGILPDGASTGEPPSGWSLWTRREILREFGLKDS
ncbi:hypothetical protein [Microbulbifer sediminum]|uniref:hypothetical protein n=1 Tax=Microbulbifer sediminum TaxID=2904250 RepID=UPI001F437E44|nr:hypothetical protein [Microbulbifer sediminum]